MSSSVRSGIRYKLGIIQAVVGAYRTTLLFWKMALGFLWLPFCIVFVADVYFGEIFDDELIGPAIARFLFGSIFVVRWSRFHLMGEVRSYALFMPPLQQFIYIFGIIIFVSSVFVCGLLFLSIVAPFAVNSKRIIIIALVIIGLCLVKVALILPAATVEPSISFSSAARLLRGNYFRLFACLLLCYLPFALFQYLVDQSSYSHNVLTVIGLRAANLSISFASVSVLTILLCDAYRDIRSGALSIIEKN